MKRLQGHYSYCIQYNAILVPSSHTIIDGNCDIKYHDYHYDTTRDSNVNWFQNSHLQIFVKIKKTEKKRNPPIVVFFLTRGVHAAYFIVEIS